MLCSRTQHKQVGAHVTGLRRGKIYSSQGPSHAVLAHHGGRSLYGFARGDRPSWGTTRWGWDAPVPHCAGSSLVWLSFRSSDSQNHVKVPILDSLPLEILCRHLKYACCNSGTILSVSTLMVHLVTHMSFYLSEMDSVTFMQLSLWQLEASCPRFKLPCWSVTAAGRWLHKTLWKWWFWNYVENPACSGWKETQRYC